MTSHSTMREQPQLETEAAAQLFDNWFDPIEAGLRDRAREFLQAMLEGELDEVLDRSRYARRAKRSADALIAGCYLSGTNTRRVRRALRALFGGAVGKDTVSRVWRKVKSDWEAWNARSLAEEPIVRLILDGTVVRVRLDREATGAYIGSCVLQRSDARGVHSRHSGAVYRRCARAVCIARSLAQAGGIVC